VRADRRRARAQVLLLDHANKAGKKILMSGGGRCNFTNMYTEPGNFLSQNAHFCKSALARYTQWDFIGMVAKHGVPYHEKKLGQLFCDNKSSDILDMLLNECDRSASACTWTPRSRPSRNSKRATCWTLRWAR
jgi:predicted flavoprotein YhiN